jgi:hypothetical protein
LAHADGFVALSDMVNEYIDRLWKGLRFIDEDGGLIEAKRKCAGGEEEKEDPPETWE